MSEAGIAAILHYLSGGFEHAPSEYYGRLIMSADIDDNRLRISFDDGKKIEIWDDGQSCCESRYMTTDDDVKSLIGGKLTRIESKNAPDARSEYGDVHEQVFIEVATDKGFITIVNHNEHNGYYGGFGLTIT